MKLEIGQTITISGITYTVREATIGVHCQRCTMRGKACKDLECASFQRRDKKNVYLTDMSSFEALLESTEVELD